MSDRIKRETRANLVSAIRATAERSLRGAAIVGKVTGSWTRTGRWVPVEGSAALAGVEARVRESRRYCGQVRPTRYYDLRRAADGALLWSEVPASHVDLGARRVLEQGLAPLPTVADLRGRLAAAKSGAEG